MNCVCTLEDGNVWEETLRAASVHYGISFSYCGIMLPFPCFDRGKGLGGEGNESARLPISASECGLQRKRFLHSAR